MRCALACRGFDGFWPGPARTKKGHPAGGQPYGSQPATSLLLSGPPAERPATAMSKGLP
jgi:hypothetical protein